VELTAAALIAPCGGRLCNLVVGDDARAELQTYAKTLPTIQLSERSLCDLELLAVGAFSPLDRFMCRDDYQSVLDRMRLANGQLFPIPITLPVNPSCEFREGSDVALCDARNDLLAVLTIEEAYPWNWREVSQKIFGAQDHPLVPEMHRWGSTNLSGPMRVVRLPRHIDFKDLRLTPAETRARLAERGRSNVVAFQTRGQLDRCDAEITKHALVGVDGTLLLHPFVGMSRTGDLNHFTRVRSYKALAQHYYDPTRVLLSLLPAAVRLAGAREALWHAVIRRNYGANYVIVGRDSACAESPELVARFGDELGVGIIPFRDVHLTHGARNDEMKRVSETGSQGVCIWFTGLSGAGKSTTAELLTVLLMERGRQVTLLDGDIVRTHLSKGLGFSKEDRDVNIRRIGFVAAEIVRHGGAAVCAAVSPYRATRDEVRAMIGADRLVEVFVDTPLEVCESRDTKGMYAKARHGEVKGFTGIDDPYEAPDDPAISLDTVSETAELNAQLILRYLDDRGFVGEGSVV
jgi:sulfate adenylyltransferase